MNEKLSFKNPWLYVDMAILYLAGSLAGVPFEGIWSVVTLGHWETHVVSMFGPFCIIYGLGGALFYAGAMALQKRHFPVKFAVFSAIGTLLELIIGLLLLRILNVRPWDYRRDFMNYAGVICLEMVIVWGIVGLLFSLIYRPLSVLLARLHKRWIAVLAIIITAVLMLDLVYTMVCIVRWKNRRDGLPPVNAVQQHIDDRYPNDFMQSRFIEWIFMD